MQSVLFDLYPEKKYPYCALERSGLFFDKSLFKENHCFWLGLCHAAGYCTAWKDRYTGHCKYHGVSVSAAFAVVNRIDDFAYTPEQNIAHAMTALMAQNKGAGKIDRMKEGFRSGIILEIIYGILIFIICFVFARPLMLMFVKDEEVIGHGVTYLHLISVMYLLPALTNGIQGFFRGIGDLKITLISSFINMALRVLAAAPLVLIWKMGIEALPYSYLAGWIGMLVAETPLLLKTYKTWGKKAGQ